MDEKQLSTSIDELAREAHALLERQSYHKGSYADRARLERVRVMLDQSWELLRQRRARLAAGLDPDGSQATDARTSRAIIGRVRRGQIESELDGRGRDDAREGASDDGWHEETGERPQNAPERTDEPEDGSPDKIERTGNEALASPARSLEAADSALGAERLQHGGRTDR